MKKAVYILAIMLLASCGSLDKSRKTAGESAQNEQMKMLTQLVDPEQPDELTASLSMSLYGKRINGQLRMRRDHSIQISASVLGLMEVARIEFLPDKVVVMDRINNRYSLCHYASLPYRNELGLDFQVIQALLWNRAFSPDADSIDKYGHFVILDSSKDSFSFKETQYGYVFKSDADLRLVQTGKDASGFKAVIDYSNFSRVVRNFSFPSTISFDLTGGFSLNVSISLSSVSVEKKNWPDQTQVGRTMKRVELQEILDDLSL